MYTECPNCHTYFKITPKQLKAAKGKVRCGGCQHVFNALTHLVEKIPPRVSSASKIEKSVVDAQSKSSHPDVKSENVSLPSSSDSINFADPQSSVDSFFLDDVSEIAQEGDGLNLDSESSPLDDINKDIDDALDNLFEDDLELNTDSKSEALEPRKKRPTEEKKEVAELDLGDDLLFDEQNDEDPLVAELEGDDAFSSIDALGTEQVEWETLTRPASPKERGKSKDPSKLDAIMSKISGNLNISRAMWVMVVCFLLLILLGQFAYSKHQELVKYPMIKPVLELACSVINVFVDCEVPGPKEVSAIVSVEPNVVGHPNASNALLITSTIRNEADFNQPFPALILTFSDINKDILARRIFLPREYLSDEVDIESGMFSNTPTKVMLEIVDPGEAAVNYEIDFR